VIRSLTKVVRLAGNASVAAGRLAAHARRLATPGPWASRTLPIFFENVRERSVHAVDVVGRGCAVLLHEALTVLRSSVAWLHMRNGQKQPLRLDRLRLREAKRALLRASRLLGAWAEVGWQMGWRQLSQLSRAGRAPAQPSPPPPRDDGRQQEQLAQYARVLQAADHYEVLSVDPSCSMREVKSAFRKLSLLLHPDKLTALPRHTGAKPEAAFQRLQAAHEVLLDEKQRARYDIDLELRGRQRGGQAYYSQHAAGAQQARPPAYDTFTSYDTFASFRADFERRHGQRWPHAQSYFGRA